MDAMQPKLQKFWLQTSQKEVNTTGITLPRKFLKKQQKNYRPENMTSPMCLVPMKKRSSVI
jgi:hypothetical protein